MHKISQKTYLIAIIFSIRHFICNLEIILYKKFNTIAISFTDNKNHNDNAEKN
ncbi:MAG: hypothetical protein HXY52_00915 [Nitrospirae bacterium]|jgi:hypothetical protein|nr:hypothetical protein [Nitrospirota bacterium]